jgi:hypothetical protein
MDAESRVAEVLGDDLHGERIVCAVYARTRRWYETPLVRDSRSKWWLALTNERVIIFSAESGDGSGWRAKRSVQAQRADVAVERFVRTGPTSWWLVLNVHTEGRWSLHSVTAFGFPLGSRPRKARQIAESLGWQSGSQS